MQYSERSTLQGAHPSLKLNKVKYRLTYINANNPKAFDLLWADKSQLLGEHMNQAAKYTSANIYGLL